MTPLRSLVLCLLSCVLCSAVAAAQAKATQMGVAVSCAVLDSRGSIVAVVRMDKAVYYTANLAIAKARAAAIFGAPSGALDTIGALHLDDYIELGKMMFHQGAVPITLGGQRAGAIGCGGSTPQQDEEAAKAGQATLREGLARARLTDLPDSGD